MNWQLGQTSKKYEVGSGGPETVSSGIGDNGGVSYGTNQLSSKTGTVADFISSMGYSKQFEGLIPGTPAFTAKWKQLAFDTNFAKAQFDYIKNTHYIPQLLFLKNNKIDMYKRGFGVQDAIWSTSVQFGPRTSLIVNALKKVDINKASDAEIVTAIQNYKISNNDSLFKSSSLKVRQSTLARARNELKDLLLLCDQDR